MAHSTTTRPTRTRPTTTRRRVRRTARTTAAALLLAAPAGCAAGANDAATEAASGSAWRLEERPALVIADDGTPETQFSRVSARRLPGGEIVVGDAGTGDVRLFGRDGRVIRRIARRGEGPGELPGEFRLASVGDTLLAFGQPPMSPPDVHLFAADGFLSRFRPAAPDARTLTALGRLATGEYVVRRGMPIQVFGTPPEVGALIPDTVTYGLLRAAGSATAAVTWLPPLVTGWSVGFPIQLGRYSTAPLPFPFGPVTLVAASGDRLWLVTTDSGVVRAVDGAGREVVAARLSETPRPWDRAQVERARDRALAAAERAFDSARARAAHDPATLPPTMPLVAAAHAGPDGELWLRLLDLDGDDAPQRFVVLDRDGREVARATLPAGLEVQQIGRDFVLGVRHDALGVPSVHEHTLHRR